MAVNFWLLYFLLYKKYFYRGMSIRSKAMISTVTSDKYEFSLTLYNKCIRQVCHVRIELLREIFSYLEELICLLSKINWIAAWCPLVNLLGDAQAQKFVSQTICLSISFRCQLIVSIHFKIHCLNLHVLNFFEEVWKEIRVDLFYFISNQCHYNMPNKSLYFAI